MFLPVTLTRISIDSSAPMLVIWFYGRMKIIKLSIGYRLIWDRIPIWIPNCAEALTYHKPELVLLTLFGHKANLSRLLANKSLPEPMMNGQNNKKQNEISEKWIWTCSRQHISHILCLGCVKRNHKFTGKLHMWCVHFYIEWDRNATKHLCIGLTQLS